MILIIDTLSPEDYRVIWPSSLNVVSLLTLAHFARPPVSVLSTVKYIKLFSIQSYIKKTIR